MGNFVFVEIMVRLELLLEGSYLVFTQEQYHPPFSSAGYKINDLTVSPVQEKRVVGEKVVLNCTADTELNVALEFQWSLPQDKVSVQGLLQVDISKQHAYKSVYYTVCQTGHTGSQIHNLFQVMILYSPGMAS